ncbi:MAG: hypothetical protein ABFS38_05880 [Bacteroidota bacterium]
MISKRRSLRALLLATLLSSLSLYGQLQNPNLFPNGDAENLFINKIIGEAGYGSHIRAEGDSTLTYWKLSDGASQCNDVAFSGANAVKLSRGEADVTATLFSNYWRVADGNMPFGLPLVAQKEITVSFRYRTDGLKGKEAFSALIRLGTIKDLPSEEDTIVLPASAEWRLVTRTITLSESKWGGEILFTLPGHKKKRGSVWIDDACLSQEVDGINLVKNHSFEKETDPETLPPDWQPPMEDQWVSWVGSRYREPSVETGESVTGGQSLRASVTYTEGSGVSQLISLHQKEVRPVIIDIWSKLDNSIGKRGSDYWSPDNYSNLTVYIYHQDGTMQEVSPTFLLGESDHDWDYRRFGFRAQKPVEEILLQITVLGSEPTTTLWIDQIRAFELGTSTDELVLRGVDLPTPSISAKWGGGPQSNSSSEIEVSNDAQNIYLTVPKKYDSKEISIYLNPQTQSAFVNHYRYLFDVVKITSDRQVYKGITVEKQGYTADGEFKPAEEYGIELREEGHAYLVTLPFEALQMAGVSFQPLGFNVMWNSGQQKHYWNGNAANNRAMGRIILAREPGIRIKSILFGKRYFHEKEQSQDFISHPQIYAGINEAEISIVNDGADCDVEIFAGIQGEPLASERFYIKQWETKQITLPYQAGLEEMTEFNVTVKPEGQQPINRTYPIQVPPAIEIILDQEFYFPEEDSAVLEIHNRYRPISENGMVSVEVTDLQNEEVLQKFDHHLTDQLTNISIDIRGFRTNPLPVQDYSVVVSYLDDNQKVLGRQTRRFGKINHTKRRELPPIEKLTVDEKGRIVINNDFYFFPIVPSVNIMEWNEAIDLGANMYRGYLREIDNYFEERDRAWEKNVYTLTIGPLTPDFLDKFDTIAENLLVHPGFLGCYGKQFYYWKIDPEYINYRKRVEKTISGISSQRLVIWGHHDSSFLYDRDMPAWPVTNPPVGYCYVKIMGRPGSAWRNAPFLTRTEMVLNPNRFKLAEVNYYTAFHDDELVPLHFMNNQSLRADDLQGFRNESYLSVIYGATGLYHWVCTQKGDLQRLRGWFQEMNHMWPLFVADDAVNRVEILPLGSKVDFRLKKWQGRYYLITANRDETVQNVSIKINGLEGMKVKKLFELPGSLSVENNMIRDVWEKYGTHVYEIESGK